MPSKAARYARFQEGSPRQPDIRVSIIRNPKPRGSKFAMRAALCYTLLASICADIPIILPKHLDYWNSKHRAHHRSVGVGTLQGSPPQITVVTRSSFRPRCFSKLQASLRAQSGVVGGFTWIISNDAGSDGHTYLREATKNWSSHEIRIVDIDHDHFYKLHNRCASSQYLNTLYTHVSDNSWIVTIDDDARLLDERHLAQVQAAASLSNAASEILLQDAWMWKGSALVRYPNYTLAYANSTFPKIDTLNVIFHKSAVTHIRFGGVCGGDKIMMKQLLNASYQFVHIKQDLPGCWANYDGAAHQRQSKCNISELAPQELSLIRSEVYRREFQAPSALWDAKAQLHHRRNHIRQKSLRGKINAGVHKEARLLRPFDNKTTVIKLPLQKQAENERETNNEDGPCSPGEARQNAYTTDPCINERHSMHDAKGSPSQASDMSPSPLTQEVTITSTTVTDSNPQPYPQTPRIEILFALAVIAGFLLVSFSIRSYS